MSMSFEDPVNAEAMAKIVEAFGKPKESDGENITPLMALQKFGCMSLSQRIGELRRQRWPILTTMVKRGRSRFASYRIDRSKS